MSRHSRQRGFVMLLAVGMVSIVSILVLLLTLRMHADVRRTRAAMASAQVSQLTLAGVEIARQSLGRSEALPDAPIALPEAIATRARLTVASAEMNERAAVVQIVAGWDATEARHEARFERGSQGWQLVSLVAELSN